MTSILVVAAHPDDEVLGCGGYIAARVKSGDEVVVTFLSDGVTSRDKNLGISEIEARRIAARSASNVLGVKDVSFGDFPDNKLDSVPILEVIKTIEAVVKRVRPSIVVTHFGGRLPLGARRHFKKHYLLDDLINGWSTSSKHGLIHNSVINV